jgi:hypothetical protein
MNCPDESDAGAGKRKCCANSGRNFTQHITHRKSLIKKLICENHVHMRSPHGSPKRRSMPEKVESSTHGMLKNQHHALHKSTQGPQNPKITLQIGWHKPCNGMDSQNPRQPSTQELSRCPFRKKHRWPSRR